MSEKLLFDDVSYDKLLEVKKPAFIFDWLRDLDRLLPAYDKKAIKDVQEDLVQQLLALLTRSSSPPTHRLIGRCLAKLFLVGDTLPLYSTVNTCNGLIKSRDDESITTSGRLAALTCLSTIFRFLGRMVGRSFEDTIIPMTKLIKQSESQIRCEVMNTLCNLLEGVGPSVPMYLKEIHKATKLCMVDRVMLVRAAAAKCLNALVDYHTPIFTNELENTVSLCFRSMDGSTYCVRMEVAKVLGHILVRTQRQLPLSGYDSSSTLSTSAAQKAHASSRAKCSTVQDALALLATGFLKGPGGFLKGSTATDMLKGVNSVNREVRIGVTYAYIEFITSMGSTWFEANLRTILTHCLCLLANPRAANPPNEALYARLCVDYMLCTLYRRLLSESVQIVAARELILITRERLQNGQGLEAWDELSSLRSVEVSETSSDGKLPGVFTDQPFDEDSEGRVEEETLPSEPAVRTELESGTSRRPFRRGLTLAQRQQQQQHVVVCALNQLTQLFRWLDSIAAPLLDSPSQLMDLLFTALAHALAPVRLAAANCIRQLSVALPTQRNAILDRCIAYLQQAQRTHGEAILGYSAAIAALLASANLGNSGIPSTRAKQIFSLAEDLLRAANQNSRLTLPRTQAAWTLLASCMTLGTELVRPHLTRMLLFWRNAFPRSLRELEAEKQRGDAFTWQVMLESRAGALCSMQAFLEHCAPILLTEESIVRLLSPIECALNMLAHLLDIVQIYGNHLKSTASLIRHRLYRILSLLPHTTYTSLYSTLLRELVAEFTLTDNSTSATTTSLLRFLCRSEDSVIWESLCQDTDQRLLEDHVQTMGGSIPGALEHDPAYLFLKDGMYSAMLPTPWPHDHFSADLNADRSSLPFSPHLSSYETVNILSGPSGRSSFCAGMAIGINYYTPSSQLSLGPVPLSVSVVDSAIVLFGRIFPSIPIRHRTQIVEHFAQCIQMAKSARQEAMQINVFASLMGALRGLTDSKASLGDDAELRKSLVNMTMNALTSSNLLLRCTAGECLGRLMQVVGDPVFLADVTQQLFDRLRSIRNPTSRAGHCLAVGCLHRYVGGLASGQHLGTSVGVLLAIAQDSSVPEVQIWALHALALVADSGGPMFREFAEPSLNLVLQLMLRSPSTAAEIQRSLGKLLSALITTLGPELQGTGANISAVRHSCVLCCLIMQDSKDALLQTEAVSCVQRLHMFTVRHLSPELIDDLGVYINSPCLPLRRAIISYLRQLSQKSADLFYEQISSAYPLLEFASQHTHPSSWESFLFARLDLETDDTVRHDIEEIILSMLQSTGPRRLNSWFPILKEILQATTVGTSGCLLSATRDRSESFRDRLQGSSLTSPDIPPFNVEQPDDEDGAIDQTLGDSSGNQLNDPGSSKLPSRWTTRYFAINCVRTLIAVCSRQGAKAISKSDLNSKNLLAHFDLALARQLAHTNPNISGLLVLYLPDLIRIAFISATSDCEKLRVTGLRLMLDVIHHFAWVVDPDCHGHSILEQYQAQISAALRPAFNLPSISAVSFSTTYTLDQTGNTKSVTNPEITSVACLVCSAWIVSGVAHSSQELHRVFELLQFSLDQLHVHERRNSGRSQTSKSVLYCDDAMTMERLAVLHAWANVYLAASGQLHHLLDQPIMSNCGHYDSGECEEAGVPFEDVNTEQVDDFTSEIMGLLNTNPSALLEVGRTNVHRQLSGLLTIYVQPCISKLKQAWLLALQDYSLLNLPAELSNQRSSHNANFFDPNTNMERMRSYYNKHWPAWLLAFTSSIHDDLPNQQELHDDGVENMSSTHVKYFDLISGLCVGALCELGSNHSTYRTNICLRSLCNLLSHSACRLLLTRNLPAVPLELLHIVHRLLVVYDNLETHLLCLDLVNYVLRALEERLSKQRQLWLTEDSTEYKPRVYPSTEPLTGIISTNGSLLNANCLVDTKVYELAEGGTLLAYPLIEELENKGDRTIKIAPKCHGVGLQPGDSIAFACLEIVICVIARHRPNLLVQIKECTSITASYNYPPIDTRSAGHHDACVVLAAAVRCLTRLPDICAPRVLLFGLNLYQPDEKVKLDETSNRNEIEIDCSDNLLSVLLQLFVLISQSELLSQPDSSPNHLNDDLNLVSNMNDFYISAPQTWLTTNPLDACDSNDTDTQISSSSNSLPSTLKARQQRREHESSRRTIDALIRWSWQQSKLAEKLIDLVLCLATHQYPVLAASQPSTSMLSSFVMGKTNGGTQPDSSSCMDQSNLSVNYTETESTTNPPNSCEQHSFSNRSASSKWYQLIVQSLMQILDAGIAHSDTSPINPLASLTLVSRIAASCPEAILKSKQLSHAIVQRILYLWSVAASDSAVVSGDDGEELHSSCQTPFVGLIQRCICLSNVELLINHTDVLLSRFFIRTLTPQLFRWLYELGSVASPNQLVDSTNDMQVDRKALISCLHISFDILESLLDLTETENRQNLSLILLPLLCNMLSENPPSTNLISEWFSSSSLLLNAPQVKCGIHLCTVQHLIAIAPRFPNEFRPIFNALGDLKSRLEKAIASSCRPSASSGPFNREIYPSDRPVITLKTDFSGFG